MAVINKNTQQILEERYFYKNPLTGETIEKKAEEMFLRVAKVAAQSEEDKEYWTNIFYELMNEQLVMPNTPTLIGAGYKDKCLSACSVIGRIPDSLDGIYDYAKYNALLTKSGLGVGQDLSNIRPKCEIIKSSGGQSAGVVNWMKLINTVAETTKQGDKARRAANMVGLRFNHPDILEFIESKRNNSDFTNMNISVVISDEEMKLIKEDKDINLVWNGKTYRTVKARDIFNKLIDNMYNHGDPGVLFLDAMNKNNPFNLQDGKFKDDCSHFIHITNPCGEQPLEAFEYCNLASINVAKIYDSKTNQLDWDMFEKVISTSIRFLDDIIDVNAFPVEQFKEKVLGSRKIGLGLTGYAELLVKMGIKYDSQQHLDFIDTLFKFKQACEIKASSKLAKEKGNALFWKESVWGQKNIPMRNLCRNTQAPTGSISTILNTTAYGIEPFFMVCYKRRIMDKEIYEANELFQTMLHNEISDDKKEQAIMKECYEKGTVQLKCVPKKLQEIFRCANDISADWHIKIQAQMQKYIDSAISKTVNAPEDDKIDDLDKRVISAWEQGVVGMTYYRNNSLDNQTIQIGNTTKKSENQVVLNSVYPIKRKDFGKKTTGTTTKYQTACGSFYLTINRDSEGHLVESFVNTSKNGTCKSTIDGLNRMISLTLRSGTRVEEIIDQLKGITCSACTRTTYKGIKTIDGLSCPDIISNALMDEYQNRSVHKVETGLNKYVAYTEVTTNKCPDCGKPLFLSEGCARCTECAYTKC